MPTETSKALGAAVAKIAKAIKAATGCDDYNVLKQREIRHQEVPMFTFTLSEDKGWRGFER